MAVIAIPLELFRRVNAPITEFYAQNAVHPLLSVETIPETRETLSFVDFGEKLSVIAMPLELFRRINAQISEFYPQNAVHPLQSIETIPKTRETRSFVDFNEK
jgi:hypothetical protein